MIYRPSVILLAPTRACLSVKNNHYASSQTVYWLEAVHNVYYCTIIILLFSSHFLSFHYVQYTQSGRLKNNYIPVLKTICYFIYSDDISAKMCKA